MVVGAGGGDVVELGEVGHGAAGWEPWAVA